MEITPNSLKLKASGVVSKLSVLEHMHEKNGEIPDIVPTIMSMLKVNAPNARSILSTQTAVLCYIQLLNKRIFIAYKYVLRPHLSVTSIQILPVNKRLKTL